MAEKQQAEEAIGGPISKEKAIKIAEQQGGSREELEEGQEGAQEGEQVSEAKETQESVKAKQSDELKIVIILNDSKVMLGVQSPDCDPVYTTLKGNLAAALKRVPKLVDEAKQKWEANPRYPKADLPTPPPSTTPARTPAASKPKTAQPSFF